MVRVKMTALYDHFPDHAPVDGEPFLNFYADTYVKEVKFSEKAIAMLLEPRALIPDAYEYVEQHSGAFKYIFTHDSKILKLPNAWMLNWADVWCTTDSEKTKGISLVSSWKNWCPLHNARLTLAQTLDGSPYVDCYGSFRRGDKDRWDDVRLAHEEYKFAVVIENDIDDFWFTEKLLNCFANKVVPIYVGATRIGELFNEDGIIRVNDWRDIPELVKTLDVDKTYEMMLPDVCDNFHRVEPYKTPWKERFWKTYGHMLEEYQDE